MDGAQGTSFSSFLAGALLVNKSVSYIDLTNYMCLFEDSNNMIISDDSLGNLYDFVCKDDNGFYLNKDYCERFNDKYTVEEYLCKLTNSDVRKFFGYEKKDIIDDLNIKKISILKRIKTRVFS